MTSPRHSPKMLFFIQDQRHGADPALAMMSRSSGAGRSRRSLSGRRDQARGHWATWQRLQGRAMPPGGSVHLSFSLPSPYLFPLAGEKSRGGTRPEDSADRTSRGADALKDRMHRRIATSPVKAGRNAVPCQVVYRTKGNAYFRLSLWCFPLPAAFNRD